MPAMGDVLVCFSCCVTQQPPRKRRRIDRSMIGYPTDFQHTGHIGAGDVCSTNNHLDSIEGQMQSKGGYEHVTPVSVQIDVVDVQKS
jgi:hypothetical protein